MANQLYLEDSYAKSCMANVVSVNDNSVVLDNTIFYAVGGGQPSDTGKILCGNEEYKVVSVKKDGGNIVHEVDKEGLKKGDNVECFVDWDRRYRLMRSHTSAHVVSGIVHRETGCRITGNQLETDKIRIDFELEDFNVDVMKKYVDMSNEIINQKLPVEISVVHRSVADNDPSLTKLAKGLPDQVQELRIVDIKGFDKQPCGGTHIKNTSEIGMIEMIKCDNKGKNNRRLYYKLVN